MLSSRLLLPAFALAVFALAACGSSSGNATSTHGTGASGGSTTTSSSSAAGGSGGGTTTSTTSGCGVDPGGTCPPVSNAGPVTTLASAQGQPSVALDGTNAYWVDQQTIMTAPLAGGTPATFASGLEAPGGLMIYEGTLYYYDSVKVSQIPLSGGAPSALYTGTTFTSALAFEPVSKTFVIVVENDTGTGNLLQTLPFQGGTTTTIAMDATIEASIAVDATGVYFSNGATVDRVDLQGKNRQTLAHVATDSFGAAGFAIAIDATDAFYTDVNGLEKVSKCGGTATIVTPDAVNTYSLALDGAYVYWTAAPSSILQTQLVKTPIHAICANSTVVKSQSGPLTFAVGPVNVLWAGGLPSQPLSIGTAVK